MSVINSTPLLAAAGGDYTISRSVRLRASASAYFNRTPAGAGNRQKYTLSFWFKRGLISTTQALFSASDGTQNNEFLIYLGSGDTMTIQQTVGGSSSGQISCATNAVFRDASAWYHVVLAIDTTQATSTNRLVLYINGVAQTFSSYSVGSSINTWVDNTNAHAFGKRGDASLYFDGYITEANLIDGQQLTSSSFGETDILTGVWKPKKYAGSYGTNGFYLNFSDNSNNTAATIGKDYSGNGNNWTPNNISVTAGTTYDSMIDVPNNYIDGGTGRGNYATLNPVNKGSNSVVLSEGNLAFTSSGGTGACRVLSTIGMTTGKWYCEFVGTGNSTYNLVGIALATESPDAGYLGASSGSYGYYASNGNKYNAGGNAAYGATFTTGDIIGIAFDADAGTLTFYKNGTSQGVAYSGIPAGTYYFGQGDYSVVFTGAFNFGQRPFSYTPPTGYLALNTQNLPDSTIKQGNKYFDATTYTGNGTSQSVVNSGSFQPDLVWTKSRTNPVAGYFHWLSDSVRGTSSGYYSTLSSNATDTENTYPGSVYGGVTALNSNGFSVGGTGFQNNSTTPYIGWQWKESATAGFDIVTYTGTGSATTIAHSLGVAPKMIITKSRSDSTYGWTTYHASVGAGAALFLNTTGASNAGVNIWNNAAPTSSVFSVGSDQYANFSGKTYVAYCFADVAGFSKFGSYTGNGSSDGPFVYCGFRPRWVMFKCSSNADYWLILDTARDTYNTMVNGLKPNASDAEASVSIYNNIDVTANGFKLRGTDTTTNGSGRTYIYAAFAENPFKNSLAR